MRVKLLSAFAMSLLLLAPPAYGISVFMADAIFDFADQATTVASPGTGSGALTVLSVPEPISYGSGTIHMDVQRSGPDYDLTEIDSRFPDEWSAALDPFVVPGDGSFCDSIDDTGCAAFVTSFDFPLTAVEVEFTDLGGPADTFDVYEVQLHSGDGASSSVVIPDLTDPNNVMAFRNDPDGTTVALPVSVDPNGVIRAHCDGAVCKDDAYVTVRVLAGGETVFRSLLFRGYEASNTTTFPAANSNSSYVGRVAVSVVPEPTTVALFGFSAVSILALARRRRE